MSSYPQYEKPNLAILIGEHITWGCDDYNRPTKRPGHTTYWSSSGTVIDASNTDVIVKLDDEDTIVYLGCGDLALKADKKSIRAIMMRCHIGPSNKKLLEDHTPYDNYRLIDSRNTEIFYVGMSKNAANRYRQHLNSKSACPRKDKRIEDIIASGFLPILENIGKSEGKFQALMHEEYWIHYYLEQGANLTNYENTSYVEEAIL